ncbi:hypothetical protein BDZ90DRAFT_281059 [Jaminaea rosea]|uniref:Uncharacterized protein n=1 Tax=Jaminaea rosea TaxID=1569628 RepID=A0A316UMB1_9BASI|nr:hypothetical protein BDZ90DRAFT_281059 [Jaminaea rosea]PWN26094.1 hypothetical protein BDZ90DRAFT_281059 [Jaminaea rosea]
MARLNLRAILFVLTIAITACAVAAFKLDERAELIMTSGQAECTIVTKTDSSGRATPVPQGAGCTNSGASTPAATPIGPLTTSINPSGSFTLLNQTSTAGGSAASGGSSANGTASSSSSATSSSLATLSATSMGVSTTVGGGSATATSMGSGNGAMGMTFGGANAATTWAFLVGLMSFAAGFQVLL